VNSDTSPVLRAPPVPAFYEHVKSAGGGAVHQRPFSFLKRALLLYDDDTVLEFEQVSKSWVMCWVISIRGSMTKYCEQLKQAISSLHGELDEMVAMKLEGLTRQQMMQVNIDPPHVFGE
jgi:hypothetical protein